MSRDVTALPIRIALAAVEVLLSHTVRRDCEPCTQNCRIELSSVLCISSSLMLSNYSRHATVTSTPNQRTCSALRMLSHRFGTAHACHVQCTSGCKVQAGMTFMITMAMAQRPGVAGSLAVTGRHTAQRIAKAIGSLVKHSARTLCPMAAWYRRLRLRPELAGWAQTTNTRTFVPQTRCGCTACVA